MALDVDRHFRREDFRRYAMQCHDPRILVHGT